MNHLDAVTAVIVTRGDVDLQPVIDSLIFPNVVIWNNSEEATDEMTYGRVLGARLAPTDVIYSQDDDITHSPENQRALVNAYEPGHMVGCMWDEWSAGAKKQGIDNGYDDLVFPGSGTITNRVIWEQAISAYLVDYELDDFFRLWCDTLIGTIAPTLALDLRFDELPHADNDNRMSHLPDGVKNKTEAIRRGREIRRKLKAV